MPPLGFTYVAGETPVHRLDARAKILLLLAFSIAVFLIQSAVGMGIALAAVAILAIVARIPFAETNRMLVPVYIFAGFSLLCNVVAHPGVEGLFQGLFFAVRMVVLVAASFVVCLTTTVNELLDAFSSLISPLRHLKAPVDDIAFTLALSVRFIPLIESELSRIRIAQKARGAESAQSFSQGLKVWGSAFSALFVGLFRHADTLAFAMDARCYGAAEHRSRLQK